MTTRLPVAAAAGVWLLLSALQSVAGQPCQPFRVLVFTKTAGFAHTAQIAAGTALIQSLGSAHGFAVDQTDDATLITAANLAQYAAVVFLHTTGDILTPAQEAAFEGYVLGGGGFVGVHSAADTEYFWPFYGLLLGAYFLSHPAIQAATITVTDPNHPSTATLPATFSHTDEWYNFHVNVASNPLVHVLLTVDESTYTGGVMGAVHPIAWYQEVAGIGRSWYTALGHSSGTYSATFFQDHLRGGILWAAGSIRSATICNTQAYGAASGTPPLVLGASVFPPAAISLVLSAGAPGASGFLGVSTCSASVTSGALTFLVDPGAGLVTLVPLVLDGAGAWQLTLPVTIQLPGSLGPSLFLQGAVIGTTVGLSNGLQISLCP